MYFMCVTYENFGFEQLAMLKSIRGLQSLRYYIRPAMPVATPISKFSTSSSHLDSSGALDGIKVLDLTRALAVNLPQTPLALFLHRAIAYYRFLKKH